MWIVKFENKRRQLFVVGCLLNANAAFTKYQFLRKIHHLFIYFHGTGDIVDESLSPLQNNVKSSKNVNFTGSEASSVFFMNISCFLRMKVNWISRWIQEN